MQDYNEALTSLEQGIRLNPQCVSAMVNLAIVHKQLGDFDKAIPLLEKVIKKIDPRDSAAINNLANIFHEQDKFEQAAIMYLQALEIDPNDDDVLCNLGMVLQRIAYNDFAKIAFEEGIHVNPGNKALLHNYLLFLLEVKQFDKFQTVITHAKRVLDVSEISTLQKLQGEFQKALGVSGQAAATLQMEKKSSAGQNQGLKSALKNFFGKKKEQQPNSVAMKFQSASAGIEEAENEEDES